ncbi:MAG: DUF4266 domain-containing protein [Methylococcales bacterium]|nr:DUF4266 domain-containing protein [Methylococcales bacterium]
MTRIFFFISISIFCIACVHLEPWERRNLAKPQMAVEAFPLLNEMRAHNFGSREAGSGSSASSGGGCGCY